MARDGKMVIDDDSDTSATTPMGVQLLSFLCGLVVAVLGFKSVHQDYRSIHKISHIDEFKQTYGKFIQVKVRRDSTGSEQEYYPDVLYEFFIDGKSIWGWRLSYEERPHPKEYWEERLKGYSPGAAVKVFYEPDYPKDAVLEKKVEGQFRTWMKMLLGLGFFFAGLTLLILPASSWIQQALTPKKT